MSRFTYCNCPAGFGAGAERHAPDCPGRRLDKTKPTPLTTPSGFSASRPVVFAPGYVKPSGLAANKPPPMSISDFRPDQSPRSSMHAVLLEKEAEVRDAFEDLQEVVVLATLGMTREEALANLPRITRHAHPDRDVVLLDGEPVVEVHHPRFNHDEFLVSFRVLRKP